MYYKLHFQSLQSPGLYCQDSVVTCTGTYTLSPNPSNPKVHLENNNIQLLPASVGQLIRCRLLDLSSNL